MKYICDRKIKNVRSVQSQDSAPNELVHVPKEQYIPKQTVEYCSRKLSCRNKAMLMSMG